ncbi:ABC transporter substrate-binding protein [Pararhodobacter aggregans]|uniref:Diguanylate cyclase n=1 Tax=Pararhodobacter aggregans TaxID=404875 RepID=A0A2T7UV12_9RHOB|nr:ABC transporter substrate-binding protein [Pararhodobacter aggregans]PTX03908.1 peptide/nickel transport system substrate-binding protein [Pararhodobacter aggregans]PVE48615.1 diguanylate cyclase [Pararhodobacter aggregans]
MKDFSQEAVDRVHPAADVYARDYRAGKLSRREFLTRATALGLAAPAAYGLIGLAAPSVAQAQTPTMGGTLKMQMAIKAQRDPRTWDWSELANACRGWLEYLVDYQRDGTLLPVLLEGWEASDDAKTYTLRVRPGVKWNNGDDFTAADVAHNFERWCDGSVEGNSMATRMGSLVENNMVREGGIEIVDDLTVRINLSQPDIALMVSVADYPAAVMHPSFTGDDPVANPIGTGPYLPVSYEPGIGAVVERNADHTWWNEGNGAYLDRIEFIDLGTDPAAWVASAESGEIDLNYQAQGDIIDIFDAIGMPRTEAVTAATIAVRFNQENEPYDNKDVRKALQLAVSNAIVLELGYNDLGTVAENHHVCPIHPEYAELAPLTVDGAAARAAIEAAGLGDYEFELISIDEPWQAETCDAVAAQIRDAGINIKRTILPGATFWNDWTKYPFSATEWNMRPLGVQILNLAYRTGVPWNEAAFSNEEFDTLLDQANGIADADARREVMHRLEEIMQEEGVLIQPYWRSIFRNARPNVHGAEMHPTFVVDYVKYWLS